MRADSLSNEVAFLQENPDLLVQLIAAHEKARETLRDLGELERPADLMRQIARRAAAESEVKA